jgi:hypothetical protein
MDGNVVMVAGEEQWGIGLRWRGVSVRHLTRFCEYESRHLLCLPACQKKECCEDFKFQQSFCKPRGEMPKETGTGSAFR